MNIPVVFQENSTQNGCFAGRKTEKQTNVFDANMGFL
jgi:hypothetical protein